MGGTAEAFFRPIGGMEEASFFHSSLNYERSASAQQKQDAAVQLSEAGETLTIVRTKHRLCDCVNRARREREDKMEEKTTMTKEPAAKNHAHSLPAPAASSHAFSLLNLPRPFAQRLRCFAL